MATFNKFQDFAEQIGLGTYDLNADQIKAMLSNAAPNATDTLKSEITEITAENGYTAGGDDILNAYTESGGTGTMTATDVVWTASSGTVGPFRYIILYNETSTSPLDGLVGWYDYGSSITLQDGETFTLDFGASVLTIA